MRRASGSSASPAGVSVMLPRARLNSGAPSSASSVLICLDSDGCATRSVSAARVKCLTSATATKYASCCSCMFNSLRLSNQASSCLGRTDETGRSFRMCRLQNQYGQTQYGRSATRTPAPAAGVRLHGRQEGRHGGDRGDPRSLPRRPHGRQSQDLPGPGRLRRLRALAAHDRRARAAVPHRPDPHRGGARPSRWSCTCGPRSPSPGGRGGPGRCGTRRGPRHARTATPRTSCATAGSSSCCSSSGTCWT